MSDLVLSLFPGADLFGMGFEQEGFCVVRGPDVQFGGDIRGFHPPAGRFDGVIGGPPCQAFSSLSGGESKAENLIPEFERVVGEAQPVWFVMENVRQAPEPVVNGYVTQSRLLDDRWLGEEQSRLRRFTCGHRIKLHSGDTFRHQNLRWSFDTDLVALENPTKSGCFTANGTQWEPGVATKRGRKRGRSRSCRTEAEFKRGCRLQGLPAGFLDKSPFTVEGKIRLVGNGVPLPMARAVARAVKRALGIKTEAA
jgi:DNA (cytosine-5)-methyltransferase 1